MRVWALLFILCVSSSVSAKDVLVVTGTISGAGGTTVNAKVQIGDQLFNCGEVRGRELCRIEVETDIVNATLLITAEQYAPVTRNFFVRREGTTLLADVGEVELSAAVSPAIEQIVPSSTNADFRFELTIHNPLDRELLIKSLELQARRGNRGLCCCPPTATFKIADIFSVVPGSANSAEGTAKELVRGGPRYSIPLLGDLIFDPCGNVKKLTLSARTSVLLAEKRYSAIQIILPIHFKIVKAKWRFGDKGLPDSALVGNGDSSDFDSYTFRLETNDPKNHSIVGFFHRTER